jgi:hypothetical protein
MSDTNEYEKLLEPPSTLEKIANSKNNELIWGQCKKLGHTKECYHWNPKNSNNLLKEKKEVQVNDIST